MSRSSRYLAAFAIAMLWSTTVAFVPQRSFAGLSTRLFSTPTEKKLPIILTGDNIDLTTPLMDYATKKVEKVVDRHREYVTKCEVHMTVNHNPSVPNSHTATATLSVKGNVIRDSVASDSMYSAVDVMTDALARKLRKYKERRRNKGHATHGTSAFRTPAEDQDEDAVDAVTESADEFDALADEYAVGITKIKSFSMNPMTPEEAALCLDYIDHPFYVFRNKDSGEVSVLYRRNSGGLGLIEPSSS